MKRISVLLLLLFTSLSYSFGQPEKDAVIGTWLTSDKDAKIEIYACGEHYCGRISWMKEPNEANGEPKRDEDNPDEKLRNRKIWGLEIMTGFEYDDDYEWEDGDIYDPETGNTYSCLMELSEDKNTLKVRGYIGLSLFGRTEIWTRSTP